MTDRQSIPDYLRYMMGRAAVAPYAKETADAQVPMAANELAKAAPEIMLRNARDAPMHLGKAYWGLLGDLGKGAEMAAFPNMRLDPRERPLTFGPLPWTSLMHKGLGEALKPKPEAPFAQPHNSQAEIDEQLERRRRNGG